MDMEFVLDQNIKEHIQAHGIMVLKYLVYIFGQGKVSI